MATPLRIPFMVLVFGGLAQGLSLNVAKVTGGSDIPPLTGLIHALAGAGILLSISTLLRGCFPRPSLRIAEWGAVAGLITVAAGWLSIVFTAPVVGASFLSLIVALIPLMTYVAALGIGLERFSRLRALGVALALSGATILAWGQFTLPDAPVLWLLAALLMPLSLTAGNIYRALRWPEGVAPDALGLAMVAGALLWLLALGFVLEAPLALPLNQDLILIATQSVLLAAQFAALLVLLKISGPVFQSLQAVAATLFGVLTAVFVLGEDPPRELLIASGLIIAGVLLAALGRRN